MATITLAAASAQGQFPGPPTTLPIHSAFLEDAKPGEARLFNLPSLSDSYRPSQAAGVVNGTTSLGLAPLERLPVQAVFLPPSNDRQEYVPQPPLATPPPSGPMLLTEPPPAPFFSWRPSYIPPGAKSGIFQLGLGRVTYLPRIGSDGFGMTSLTKQITLALPPFISGSPILFTPSYTSHFLDGPGQAPVPRHLMDIELEFRYMKQVTPRFGIDLAAAPSYFGDGGNDSRDAWRVTGRVVTAWNWTETVQLVSGGLYLGRSDYPAVPIGGIIWKPSPDYRFDILVPRPRAYYRTYAHADLEYWLYLGGEFGGNTWAINRPHDIADKMTYNDLRLLVGLERRLPGGVNGRLELGWVFNRSIEFQSGFPGFDPTDTLMLRGEASF